MAITLQEPTGPLDPTSRHAFPDMDAEPKLSAPPTIAEELLDAFRAGGTRTETSFELASHGGYARTVTGTVAYLDEEAQTFMVRTIDGRLMRVPLRDVTSAQGETLSAHEALRSSLGVEGLGTGGSALG